jgi:septum formation protein
VVAVAGGALGQPSDANDAARMLRLLAGRTHSVLSSVCVLPPGGTGALGTAISRVAVEPLSEAAIARYIATGEPTDKAGAYAIQGTAADFCRLERGRLDTVIGLPGHTLRALLRRLGYPARITDSARLGRP